MNFAAMHSKLNYECSLFTQYELSLAPQLLVIKNY